MLQQRKHIRLRDFDYSSPNAYFITVCVRYFEPLLGTIKSGICGLSEIGNETALNLQNVPVHYPDAVLDEVIVMPNHWHCILIINQSHHSYTANKFANTVAGSVSTIVGHVKGAVTKWCKDRNVYFKWQPRFYDHIIRNAEEYWAIKSYIINNPGNWKDDCLYQ